MYSEENFLWVQENFRRKRVQLGGSKEGMRIPGVQTGFGSQRS